MQRVISHVLLILSLAAINADKKLPCVHCVTELKHLFQFSENTLAPNLSLNDPSRHFPTDCPAMVKTYQLVQVVTWWWWWWWWWCNHLVAVQQVICWFHQQKVSGTPSSLNRARPFRNSSWLYCLTNCDPITDAMLSCLVLSNQN